MAIPEEIENKLDSDSQWKVQHKDIVDVMDTRNKNKPWSRYMIQQYLEGEPTKNTVQDRLNELVELDVLIRYEYTDSNMKLYDLAYDPIITDGGQLRNANFFELITLQDTGSVRDLVSGALIISYLFFGIGILSESLLHSGQLMLSESVFFKSGILVYMTGAIILLSLIVVEKTKALMPFNNISDRKEAE